MYSQKLDKDTVTLSGTICLYRILGYSVFSIGPICTHLCLKTVKYSYIEVLNDNKNSSSNNNKSKEKLNVLNEKNTLTFFLQFTLSTRDWDTDK